MGMHKKGMSMALTLVISIVVLIVIALAIITITTQNVAKTGNNTETQQDISSCNIWRTAACAGQGAGSISSPYSNCDCTCDGKHIACEEVQGQN